MTRRRKRASQTARNWNASVTRPSAAGRTRPACRDAGHDTVIKPSPLQPAVPDGFTLDDFTVGEKDQGTVTCPACGMLQADGAAA